MTKLNPYLNFDGQAEEAFNFYQSVFGGTLQIHKMGEMQGFEVPEAEKNRVMHVSLPMASGDTLMASDTMPSAGHVLKEGNNAHISLHPDSKAEADRLFNGLSAGGSVEMPLQDTFWGAYFGSFKDKYGIYWMINCEAK